MGASGAARCKKSRSIAEELKSPSAADMVSNITDEATASKPKAIPPSDNTVSLSTLSHQQLEDVTLLSFPSYVKNIHLRDASTFFTRTLPVLR